MENIMSELVLEAKSLAKSYREGPQSVDVLADVEIAIRESERVAIIGVSGSGKSTLLNLLGGLDSPDAGTVAIHGKDFSTKSDNERGRIRNASLGFVYQFHHLLPEFSAEENIAMPLRIAGKDKKYIQARTLELLHRVGLESRGSHRPSELSGGERQRVAIARALANKPACVLMDEPTGNLDKVNAENIHALINELSQISKTAFIVVTHDEALAQRMDRVLKLEDGRLNAYNLENT
ncbi:MAG: lipoprotein-releasing system ATP-binding protein [Flavobacteriales bacterium]|jgi:lipoprotein-releasing system ATP-binding protein